MLFKLKIRTYPCDASREILENLGTKNLPAGKRANVYLAQLIASESLDPEKTFYTPEKSFKQVDDDMKTPKVLLAPGENGFASIMAKGGKPLTDIKSFMPLILATIGKKGEGEPVFNADIYGGKFVMARQARVISTTKDILGRPDGSGSSKPAGIPSSEGTSRRSPPLSVQKRNRSARTKGKSHLPISRPLPC